MPPPRHPRPWRLARAANLLCAAFLLWDIPSTGRGLISRLGYPYSAATIANLREDIKSGAAHQFPGQSMFYHAGEKGVQTSLDADTAGDFATLLAEDPGHTLWLELYFRKTEHGGWAVTGRREAYIINTSYGHELTPAQVADARATFAQWLAANDYIPSERADTLARIDTQGSGRDWLGYTHNAASLAALLGFALTLRWIPDARRAARASRLTKRGQCSQCGYSLAGSVAPLCPECGKPLTAPRPPHSA